jgi:hypothetical protein
MTEERYLFFVLMPHTFAVAWMTGLIWLVQFVHYPLMARVGRSEFAAYHRSHSLRISWIVIPLMTAELVTAVGLVLVSPGWDAYACLGLTVACFAFTALLSVPCHSQLAKGFDQEVHRRLVLGNWPRMLAWSAHSLICARLLIERLPSTMHP